MELGYFVTWFPAYLALGALSGILAGLLGVGGGLVIVPALAWIFRANGFNEAFIMHLALGTSLATIVITSMASGFAHHRRGAVQWPLVAQLAPGLVAGAWLGSLTAGLLPTLVLQKIFAGFAILMGIRMLTQIHISGQRPLPGWKGMGLAGTLIGTISAIVGIGGGSLTVPFLNWCRIEMRFAVAASSACGLPLSLAGAAGFAVAGWQWEGLPPGSSGFIHWPALAGIVATSILFAPLGAKWAHYLPASVLKKLFAALLLLLGSRLLI